MKQSESMSAKMNQSVKSVIVLVAICLVVTSLLAGVNHITAPIIKEKQDAIKYASMYEVLPQAQGFEDIELTADMPQTITGIYKETSGNGYVVTAATSSQYSNGDMMFTIGMNGEGKIVDIKLTQYTDSKDFGADYPSKYIGADASSVSGVDTVGGVTYSSTAFKNAVADAFTALSIAGEGN